MTHAAPDQVWWTARELAEAGLPDMPQGRTGVEAMAKRLNWRGHPQLARRRKGRGGGWEYHWKLLPLRAQKKLLAEAAPAEAKAPSRPDRDEAWSWFETMPEKVQAEARRRLDVIQKVEALVSAGNTKFLAVGEVARMVGKSDRTIWNWFDMIEGVRADDRLPYLAPRHRAVKRASTRAECSDEFWEFLKADFLRAEAPSFSTCYRRAAKVARDQGWTTLPDRTMRRRVGTEIPKTTQILCRKGVDALKALYPAQTRDRRALHAMEAVNADYHRFDVFVRWPLMEGVDEEEIVRPQLIAFQDIYSGRILSWRLDKTPNKVGVSLALGDMVERFGIPEHILLDNGREFANKFLTGQVPTRFRFKVKDDDIPGILKTLGCEVHWATPYSGQSKPIERAFRDLCDAVAKDPRLAGAYTGNRPDAKPENYGSRAIPLERFIEIVEEGIEEHNTRAGRRGQTAQGRSLLETFEASYASAPIRKATEEQRRLWLMGAVGIRCDSKNGLIRFLGNEYWSPWLHAHMGEKVVARFDPADLRAGLHLYALDGGYLGLAECKLAAGFFDLEEARNHSAARRKWMKAEKAAAEAARKFKLAEIGDYLDAARSDDPAPDPEAKVVKPVFKKAAPTQQVPQAKLASFALSIAAMVYAFFVNRRKDVDERFADGSKRMDRHEARIQTLEQTVQGMPGKDEMHELQIALVTQTGALNEMKAVMEGNQKIMSRLEAIVSRHEEHLLNGGSK